jgi:hypothetical protein
MCVSFLHPQPQLDQAADGFGAAGEIVLLPAPVVELFGHIRLQADPDQLARDGGPLPWCFRVNVS